MITLLQNQHSNQKRDSGFLSKTECFKEHAYVHDEITLTIYYNYIKSYDCYVFIMCTNKLPEKTSSKVLQTIHFNAVTVCIHA